MRSTVYVDISQFYAQPARSGIQRVIGSLFLTATDLKAKILYVFEVDGSLYQLDHENFYTIFKEFWASGDQPILKVRILDKALALPPQDVLDGIYFLPEVTYLSSQAKIREHFESRCVSLAMVFDLFPMTHPEFFEGNGMVGPSQYFRELANFDRHICISDYTRDSLLSVHPKLSHYPEVIFLETDFASYRNQVTRHKRDGFHFIVVGTLEPRKRHLRIFEVFERINATASSSVALTFIGREGWLPSWQLDFFHDKVKEHDWFEIISNASDNIIAEFMLNASGLISVGFEGFGLPIIEARSLGCPVIFGGVQPAGRYLKDAYCIEISDPDHEQFESDLVFAIRDVCNLYSRTFRDSSLESFSLKIISLLNQLILD